MLQPYANVKHLSFCSFVFYLCFSHLSECFIHLSSCFIYIYLNFHDFSHSMCFLHMSIHHSMNLFVCVSHLAMCSSHMYNVYVFMAISRQKETRTREYALSYRMTSNFLYNA